MDPTPIESQTVPCFDPSCPGTGEPEQDGEHLYYTCSDCGNDFGWERAPQPTAIDADGACAIGVPADLRRAASAGMEQALGVVGTPVSIGRKKPT